MSRTSSWEPSWSRLGCVLEASWAPLKVQDTSKLASQIEGKSIKNPCKNRSKIRCLPSSSFDAIWVIFGRKMEARWHQDRIKIDASFERPILQKVLKNERLKNERFFNVFCGLGYRSWHQKAIKNRSKIKVKMNCLLASIFVAFWWVLGGTMGWKIDPKAHKNQLKNVSKKM